MFNLNIFAFFLQLMSVDWLYVLALFAQFLNYPLQFHVFFPLDFLDSRYFELFKLSCFFFLKYIFPSLVLFL